MSKVKEIQEKYPSVSNQTFERFVKGDKTPTKKYLEYLVKSWVNRKENGFPNTIDSLISLVRKFDDVLPYIENKDIYSKNYVKYSNLKFTIEKAEEDRIEKTFNKGEHISVLTENENHILVIPKTHVGSLKYGAKTKWCTASKNDLRIFNNYSNNGLLVYILDKKNSKTEDYRKVAFYLQYSEQDFSSNITMFNAKDAKITETAMIENGWTVDDIFEFTTMFRYAFYKRKYFIKANKEVDTFVHILSSLDFNKFNENLKKLEHSLDDSYISNIKNQVDNFLTKLKQIECHSKDQKLISENVPQ